MNTPARPVHLTIESDGDPLAQDSVPLHWRRGRTGADGVKRDYAYLRVGGVTVSFYPGEDGQATEIRTHKGDHRLVPHGYSNHESGDVLYVRFVEPADHDSDGVRQFLAKVTASALRAIRGGPGKR